MIEIVELSPEWVPQVAEMETLCFCDPWSERSIASEVENPLSLWLVAVQDGRAAGYVGSQTVLGETDMMNVAVSPEARRKGIAQGLILTLEDELKLLGSHCLTLEVRASNIPAIALYKKLEFSQVGRLPNYYRNPKEDALILRKEWQI